MKGFQLRSDVLNAETSNFAMYHMQMNGVKGCNLGKVIEPEL